MGVQSEALLVDGWMLERQVTDDEYEVYEEHYDNVVTYDPMCRNDVIFFGNIIRSGEHRSSSIIDLDNRPDAGEVPDPPFAPQDWKRGRWLVSHYR